MSKRSKKVGTGKADLAARNKKLIAKYKHLKQE